MSTAVVTWVFQHSQANGNDRLVLLAIADEADDDGSNSYPSVDRISAKARVNKRTCIRAIQRLEELGELVVIRPDQRGRGHHNRYRVVTGKSDTLSNEAPAEPVEAAKETVRIGAERRAQECTRPIDPLTKEDQSQLLGAEDAPKPKARKTRITDEFTVTPQMEAWARKNTPTISPMVETPKFIDYWMGRGDPMADWVRTWQNWMRNAKKFAEQRTNGNAARPSNAVLNDEEADRALRSIPSGAVDAGML